MISTETETVRYEDSNFLNLYLRYLNDREPPSQEEVDEGLENLGLITLKQLEEENGSHPGMLKAQKLGVAAKAVCLYTSDYIYEELAAALREDCYEELQDFMPLIRAINCYIFSKAERIPRVTHRGSHVQPDVLEDLEPGSSFHVPSYLSTSESEEVAKEFADPYMVKLNLPPGYGRSIADVSLQPQQKEVLLPPYTCVTLKRKEKGVLECDVKVAPFRNTVYAHAWNAVQSAAKTPLPTGSKTGMYLSNS